MIMLLGKEINTTKELIETILDDITIDDLADECTGTIQRTIDKDWIHDVYCDCFDDDDEYEEFKRMLEEDTEFDGEIDLDIGDSMYHMSGGGFSSWADYYNYRFG